MTVIFGIVISIFVILIVAANLLDMLEDLEFEDGED